MRLTRFCLAIQKIRIRRIKKSQILYAKQHILQWRQTVHLLKPNGSFCRKQTNIFTIRFLLNIWYISLHNSCAPLEIFDPPVRVESLGLSYSGTTNLHANPKPVRQILVSLAFNMFLQITKHTPGRYGFSVTCLYWSLLLFLGWFTASVIPWSPETDIFTISCHNRILKKELGFSH